jgi:flagellar biosynthesis protein FlhB
VSSEDKDQRTEDATPRRREKAREEGQIARSQDVAAAATFGLATGVLALTLAGGVRLVARHAVAVFESLGTEPSFDLVRDAGLLTIQVVAPPALATFVAALVSGFGQAGMHFSLKPLVPDLNRLDPIKALGRLFFSSNAVVEVLKGFLKIGVIGAIVGEVVWRQIGGSTAWTVASAGQLLERLADMSLTIGLRAGVVMIGFALIDYLWQRRQYEQNLKMTKHEVKEEHKEAEGSPEVKIRRRMRMRELVRQRRHAVKEAAVVVVNPTHVAGALGDRPPPDHAPVVVAKGIDEGALRIREEARRHGIPIHHDRRLARQLVRRVPKGKPIPSDLYRAVAAVLAAVLQTQGRAGIR